MENEKLKTIDQPASKAMTSTQVVVADSAQHEELKTIDQPAPQAMTSTHVVIADSVQADEVPTIALASLYTISALQPEIAVHSVASTRVVSTPTPLAVRPLEHRRSLREWLSVCWDGIRPAYLPLSVLPVLVGSILAWTQTVTQQEPFGAFHLMNFLGVIVAVLLLQVGAHLVNDYYDYLHGIDTANPFGPGGLIQQGLIKPTRVLTFGLGLLGVGAIVGIVVATTSPLLYVFGLIGLLCAFFYSATSRSLASIELGELVTFCVFGPVITMGAYLVQLGHLTPTAFFYSLPLGLFAAAVTHANNMRDLESDTHAGKHTIASRLGTTWSRVYFLCLLIGAYLAIVTLGIPHNTPHLLLITLWTLPGLVVVTNSVLRADTLVGFHLVMHETLKLETLFTILWLIALIVWTIILVLPSIPTHLLPT